ncbi:MAG: right-handed parallel beta-helix repeat-containing protein [Parcubacteria group bacterium]|jgi:parallel beta-helix repeat protein
MEIRRKIELAGVALLAVVFIVPIISLAGGTKEIFVDDGASGDQDGTYSHPYSTIGKAIEKAEGKTKIIVRKGVYKENIVIPRDVKISGSDNKKVTIQGKDNDKPTVTMGNKTELTDVTVTDGKNGILVKNSNKKGEITVSNCLIKNAKSDGIKILEGSRDSDRKVNIVESKIYSNGKSGIYSEKRRLVILDNEIFENDLDGIDIEESANVYIAKNEINQNDGVGVKLRLDNTNATVIKNSFYKNERDAVEIKSRGKIGAIIIRNNKFVKNDGYGIARVLKNAVGYMDFRGLSIDKNNVFSQNKKGTISAIIKN